MGGSLTAPYGTWASPITANAIVEGSISIDDVLVDPVRSTVYHIEKRPSEGRNVLVNTKTNKDVFGRDWNARTAVHEYGGGAAIVHGGDAYFSNMGDGRVYKIKEGDDVPQPVTPESTVHRFADFSVHPIHTHLLVAILEDHTDDRPSAVHNEICMINTLTQELRSFVSGADFYSSPRFSPDGARIAWKQWFHPDMPWEGAEIYVADIQVENDTFIPKNTVHIAGERGTISVSYPLWVSNDALIFTNDESGYQNPWIFAPGPLAKAVPIFNVAIAEDFGGPAWTLGGSPFAPLDSSGKRMLFVSTRDGRSALYLADLESRTLPLEIECPYAVMQNVRQVPAGNAEVVFIGCKVDESQTLVHCTLQPVQSTKPKYKTLKSTSSTISAAASFPLEIVSIPQPITLEVTSGEPLHVVFYPPNNPEYAGTNLPGELPPCVLNVHGGPTWMTGQGLDWEKTFYTSRGWAWLDVNYGGSSGYGRQYIERLAGKWGIVDVEDCICAARKLSGAPHNLIDSSRVVIRGGSAGGFTVLAALAVAPVVTTFAAGTSLYGVSDLRKLGEDTHKFESRYLEKLIGGTMDEIPKVYEERSPVFHADRIVTPLLILQGDIDLVVPKEQAEIIVKSIKERGGRVEYKLYEGEGHGWRQAKNIVDALEREMRFYEKVLKIT